MSYPDEDTRRENIEVAAFRLLSKFHIETDCGQPDHWAECSALVDALGWVSWEAWEYAVMNGVLDSQPLDTPVQ